MSPQQCQQSSQAMPTSNQQQTNSATQQGSYQMSPSPNMSAPQNNPQQLPLSAVLNIKAQIRDKFPTYTEDQINQMVTELLKNRAQSSTQQPNYQISASPSIPPPKNNPQQLPLSAVLNIKAQIRNKFPTYTEDQINQMVTELLKNQSQVQQSVSMNTDASPSTSFTTKKINSDTFVIREDDAFGEHPLIYVKIHPKVPLIVVSDTGCDEPSDRHKDDRYIHLRDYIENYPIESNNNEPLNPSGVRQYYIICTHCHYDHIGGISQFLSGGTTEIIASSAGRDFIESDLETHGHFKFVDRPVPWYRVTYYAESLERLKWPLWHVDEGEPKPFQTDLGISIIHTPGHTPDELAWYDHVEMHLFCGDSFYEEGEDGMAILFPGEGNLVEWVFAMQKLLVFVRSENARAAKDAEESSEEDWLKVAKRVKVSCAHQTTAVDGAEILERLERFSAREYQGKVPVVKKEYWHEDAYYTWRDADNEWKMSLKAPAHLMDKARRFFNLYL